MEQLATEVDGLTRLDLETFKDLARRVADETSSIKHLESRSHSELFGVQRAGRVVATFDAAQRRREVGQDDPDGRIRVGVSWSDETIEQFSRSHDGTVGLARGYLFGLPGFGPYRQYLDGLVAAVRGSDGGSTVRVEVDP